MATRVEWNDRPIRAAVPRAHRIAALATKQDLLRNVPTRRIGAFVRFTGRGRAFLKATGGLAHLFEGGTKAHLITPKKVAMKLPDGGFVRGPVQHPGMRARPFFQSAALTFPAHYVRALFSLATRRLR